LASQLAFRAHLAGHALTSAANAPKLIDPISLTFPLSSRISPWAGPLIFRGKISAREPPVVDQRNDVPHL